MVVEECCPLPRGGLLAGCRFWSNFEHREIAELEIWESKNEVHLGFVEELEGVGRPEVVCLVQQWVSHGA